MRITRVAGFAMLALVLAAPSARAWNEAGHLIIAGMTYDRLTPAARERVDDLIRKHPDYSTILLRGATGDAANQARMAFMVAARWPDIIRSDPRFHDDAAPATPALVGFPDMQRHVNWHSNGLPFSPDGTHLVPAAAPNAHTELQRLIAAIGGSVNDANPVYDLPWLLHIGADIHNPVHAATRFTSTQPQGDRIALQVIVAPGISLHTVWDNALGEEPSPAVVNRSIDEYAAEFAQSDPANATELDPEKWIAESFDLAVTHVYSFGLGGGSAEQPILLDAAYLENAREVSSRQAGLAAARISAILNQQLK